MAATITADAGRRSRAAIALIGSHGPAFRRTARRFSLCADDAEDAFAQAVEILLTKAPDGDSGRLAAWMHVVTRREALAVRRARERLLGAAAVAEPPSEAPGPAEWAERRERITHSAAALAALKPQERRALALKAEGYSYAEMQALTGWTYTKVNRCMAEGRKSFLANFARIADGGPARA